MQNGRSPEGLCEPPPSRIPPGTSISQHLLPESAEPPPSPEDPDSIISRAPRSPHTWTQCPGSAFHVRQGPNYAATGKKAPSGAPLYDAIACDAFTSETKLPHLARVMALPDEPSCSDVPPLLIINFMIPNYPPSGGMLTSKRTDGPGWNLVLYCRLNADVRRAIKDGRPAPPAVDLWRRFVHPTDGLHLRQNRVKMIFGLTDTEEPGFSLVTKTLVNRYNYKPFLSKTACSFYSVPGKYFEIDVDIHTWSSAALNGLNTIKSRMSTCLGRVGTVIEADDDEDMPEQMLTGMYLTYLDPAKCLPFDPTLTRYLNDERNLVSPLPGAESL